MNPLLIYFKEECIELWSLDNNGRLLPVKYNSSNKIPLYFLISGEQIMMDNYAKEQYFNGIFNSFGDFWKNIDNYNIIYERFSAKNLFVTLLPYALKESILPSIAKSHFHTNLSSFLNAPNTIVLFDSFVCENHKEIILKLFFEIIGFDPNSIVSIDFFDCFRDIQIKKKVLIQNDSFILINISAGNFYIHLLGKNPPLHLAKKVLEGKGQDPLLEVVLEFLAEFAHAKGSELSNLVIKRELINDAKIVLSKIQDGLVLHTIKNNNIDISPLKISFHRNDIEGRINNRQSLNYIQNEFDIFRKQNNAEQLPIFLYGDIINQEVFRDFFSNTYSKVNFDTGSFINVFLVHCLNRILDKQNPLQVITSTPTNLVGNYETKTDPIVNQEPNINIPDSKISNVVENLAPIESKKEAERFNNNYERSKEEQWEKTAEFSDEMIFPKHPVNIKSAGENVRIKLKLTSKEMRDGVTKKIKVKKKVVCYICDGSGFYSSLGIECPECSGDGSVAGEEMLSIDVPAKTKQGMQFRMEGRGNAGQCQGPAGDLLVVIEEKTGEAELPFTVLPLTFEQILTGVQLMVYNDPSCPKCVGLGASELNIAHTANKAEKASKKNTDSILNKIKGAFGGGEKSDTPEKSNHIKVTVQCGDCKDKQMFSTAVSITPGASEGMRIEQKLDNLRSWIFEIKEIENKFLVRNGLDVHYKLEIINTLIDQVSTVPSIKGNVKIKIPKGTTNGQKFRLKGIGFPDFNNISEVGYEIVEIFIIGQTNNENTDSFFDKISSVLNK